MSPEETKAEADRSRDEGRYEEALALYRAGADGYRAEGREAELLTCLDWIGRILNRLGRYEEATSPFREAVETAVKLGGARAEVIARFTLGQHLHSLSHYPEVVDALRRAAEIAGKAAPEIFSEVLIWLADAHSMLGQDAESLRLLRQAHEVAERAGDPKALCHASYSLANALGLQGQIDAAMPLLELAADIALGLEDHVVRCDAFRFLGEMLRARGDLEAGLSWMRRAAAEAEQLDDPLVRCSAFRYLGNVLRDLGRYGEAEREFTRAIGESERIDNAADRCYSQRGLGSVLSLQGRYDEALIPLRRAAEEARRLSDPMTRSNAFALLGNVLSVLGRFDEAMPWRERAAEEALRFEDPINRANAFSGLADLFGRQGRFEEAGRWLERARQELGRTDDPAGRLRIAYTAGMISVRAGRWEEGVRSLASAGQALLASLSRNRRPDAVGNMMATYGPVFHQGLAASERAWAGHEAGDGGELWGGLDFADGAKCVTIREALRRHAHPEKTVTPAVWRATGTGFNQERIMADEPFSRRPSASVRAALRGLRIGQSGDGEPPPILLEMPDEVDPLKNEYCQPISREGVARLLPDRDTVLVVFYFAEDDLIVLPLRRDARGAPDLLRTEDGYFRVPGALPRVRELLQQQGRPLGRARHLKTLPSDPGDGRSEWTSIYRDLYRELGLDSLLTLVEPDRARWQDLHLVLIPDGPLYLMPIHAACAEGTGARLYQQVASVRYALSLRTLELQQDIQDSLEGDVEEHFTLRGVAFGNPDRGPIIADGAPLQTFLPGVIRESSVLVEETGVEQWWLHCDEGPEDRLASRANFRQRHTAGNLGWIMCHGGIGGQLYEDRLCLADGRQIQVQEPALRLVDGPVSMSRLLGEGYDFSRWRLMYISACLMGELTLLGASKEVLGYLAVLTLLGCRRVVSAMWEVSDEAAPEMARQWVRALMQHAYGPGRNPGPHTFAIAFKQALDGFRAAHGRFDHEFFWAPFTLYGLG
jgi:tetratricopeptide (TPR) repeat protein